VPEYAAALLMRGRILLADNKPTEAVAVLRPAAEKSPLPEYLWTLADALRAAGQPEQASVVEKKLVATGTANDPRTFALYLATRGTQPDLALRLSKAELDTRQDIFTRDAVAWAAYRKGDLQTAQDNSQAALSEGTKDARLFYHAGIIAAVSGHTTESQAYLNEAKALEQMLMPSERTSLEQQPAFLPRPETQVSSR